jgi:hypothetical protein
VNLPGALWRANKFWRARQLLVNSKNEPQQKKPSLFVCAQSQQTKAPAAPNNHTT